MFDVIGSMRVVHAGEGTVVVGLKPTTRWAGRVALVLSLFVFWSLLGGPAWLLVFPMILVTLSTLVMTLERTIHFSKADGVAKVKEGFWGRSKEKTIPLFHVRAVMIKAKGKDAKLSSNFVCYLSLRAGGYVFIDESKRSAPLIKIADAICEQSGLRLEFDATLKTRSNR